MAFPVTEPLEHPIRGSIPNAQIAFNRPPSRDIAVHRCSAGFYTQAGMPLLSIRKLGIVSIENGLLRIWALSNLTPLAILLVFEFGKETG